MCTLPVTFPEGSEAPAAAAVNGAAVPAVTTTEAKDAPAAAAAPAAAPEPAALDPATAAVDPASPTDDEFKTPLGSPLVGATQELSLQDDHHGALDDKKLKGDAVVSEKAGEAEAVANGKPVAAS